jgi:hypothetical protein
MPAILGCTTSSIAGSKVACMWQLVVPGWGGQGQLQGQAGLSNVPLAAFALSVYHQHSDPGDSCCRQLNGCEPESTVSMCVVSGVSLL